MATFVVTTPVNISTLSGKTGSDTYTINGGYLTVDQHTRYGTNQSTSAAMGNVTLSATLGGTIEFNSTKVRLIPYDTGSGTVPAYDTVISQGGASGILLGVYANLTSAPTTVGAAMPASGYILIRQWNDIGYSASSLTGISATATGVDRAGWLEIVGVDALSQTVYRLNKWLAYGDYYDFLGATTDGNRSTGYQFPSNGSNVFLPGIEVETDVPGIYEFYPNAGSKTALSTNIATDYIRGRWCWVSTGGLITFGNDGTNSTGGYCPPAGRKIRVPNLVFHNCTAAVPTVNTTPHATLATRMEFAVTGGAFIEMDKVCTGWYLNLNQPFVVNLTNTFIFDNLTLTECASPISWSNVGIGQSAALSNFGLLFNYNFAGGTMDKCTWTRSVVSASGNYIKSISYCSNFIFTNERCHHNYGTRGNASSGVMTILYSSNCNWENCLFGGGKSLISNSTGFNFKNTSYYDHPATTTSSTIPCYIFEFSFSSNHKIDGVDFAGLSLVQPYNGIFSASTFSSYIRKPFRLRRS